MKSHMRKAIVAAALLSLIAMPYSTLGQEKADAKSKPAKSKAAKSKGGGKKAAGQEAKAVKPKSKSKKKGAGEVKSKLDRLRLAMAKQLDLTAPQKERINALLRDRMKAAAESAKAKEMFEAEHGAEFKALQAKIGMAKKAKDEARLKELAGQMEKIKEVRAKALEQHRPAKIDEFLAAIEKVLQPGQVEKFRKLLVELKFAAGDDAGASLSAKLFMKAIMAKSVGLSDRDKDGLKLVYTRHAAAIKTAAKDKAKIKEITQTLRSEVKSKLTDKQWRAALDSLAQLEKKIRKEREEAAKAAAGKKSPQGKTGKKPQGKKDKKPQGKDDKKGDKDKGK